MFTLHVSWLLVACVPALLMLTTLGLGRLEQTLSCDTVTASDVAEFLEQAQAADVHRLARDGMPEALAYLHRREAPALTEAPATRALTGKHHADPYRAAPRHIHSRVKATRHINRV
ncbi:hypothetical protein C3469_05605 [Mycobacterium kansasii]|uniref:hypothetical protein n=1 Tax=Mycobacterium kansasii TaxID=1768 RepID=UPI000CDE4ABB|nr:hypothetical protein [Mycobacterium kansasii]POX90619.1 hypothetical protein C3B43_06375 [Mycobacterium kansasii]POY02260.1 hypothetical protein C3479_09725 [Mycobacterium kansasii]POY07645.1 hypothetical protein C3477_06645 [Mycobacterium kansasii]POY22679.1 hypothetical protein C3476_10570 [Mycobacterium kansasii]POY28793.1 hypothetical protein C3469_05605 [Mycobacterium kansasii]